MKTSGASDHGSIMMAIAQQSFTVLAVATPATARSTLGR
jgi:hypothetical protein